MSFRTQLAAVFAPAILAVGVVALSCSGEGASVTPTPQTPTKAAEKPRTPTEVPRTATQVPRTATGEPTATPTVSQATPTPSAGVVVRLQIPAIGVDAQIEPIGLVAGENRLDVPKDPHDVGWYDIYARPGWGGNAVFSAHVNYYPNIKAAFFKLATLEAGQEIVVVMEDGATYRYQVISNTRYLAETMPLNDITRAAGKPADEEWVTLITCGGDSRPVGGGRVEYLHRDVVVAARTH